MLFRGMKQISVLFYETTESLKLLFHWFTLCMIMTALKKQKKTSCEPEGSSLQSLHKLKKGSVLAFKNCKETSKQSNLIQNKQQIKEKKLNKLPYFKR